jgi:hypothetical protein
VRGLPRERRLVFEEATRRRVAEDRIVAGRESRIPRAIVPSADYLGPYLSHLSARRNELYQFVDRHGDTLALRADFTMRWRGTGAAPDRDRPPTRVFYRRRCGADRGTEAARVLPGRRGIARRRLLRRGPQVAERCLAALRAAGADSDT